MGRVVEPQGYYRQIKDCPPNFLLVGKASMFRMGMLRSYLPQLTTTADEYAASDTSPVGDSDPQ